MVVDVKTHEDSYGQRHQKQVVLYATYKEGQKKEGHPAKEGKEIHEVQVERATRNT